MGSSLPKRAPSRTARWLRSGDGFRVTVMTAALVGVLVSAFVVATASRTSPVAASGTQTQAGAEPAPDARDHRTGSILFVSRKKMCEELRFDNVSEQILSVAYVDCEARLAREIDDDARARSSARTLSVFAAFRK